MTDERAQRRRVYQSSFTLGVAMVVVAIAFAAAADGLLAAVCVAVGASGGALVFLTMLAAKDDHALD